MFEHDSGHLKRQNLSLVLQALLNGFKASQCCCWSERRTSTLTERCVHKDVLQQIFNWMQTRPKISARRSTARCHAALSFQTLVSHKRHMEFAATAELLIHLRPWLWHVHKAHLSCPQLFRCSFIGAQS